ncbi:50S ribosomal protein L23, partial [Cycloclasticus sp. 46_83_sub15_T18]
NKTEIKAAVEKLFDVTVESVKTLNVKGKTKRFGKGLGKRSDVKKAYVRIKSGQEIEFVSA